MKLKTLIIAEVSVAAACITGLAVFGAMKIAKALKPRVNLDQELLEDIVKIRSIK
jgi:hypothetical protein